MNLRKSFAFVALFLSMVLIAACSDGNKSSSVNKNEKEDDYENKTDPNLNMDRDDLGQEHSIVIKFGNGAPAIDNPYENDVTITSNGENVVVNVAETSANIEYNLIVSGTTTNGSLKIYGQHNMGIFLNSVDITNPRGPAINIQSGGKISVNLVGGTYNYLADGANYNPTGEEDAKGTLFSEKRLLFKGIGSLEVESKYNHAIVVDNDFEMESGRIKIKESANDGIHANDAIYIRGGVLDITSRGDAIQNENLPIHISGGKITAETSGAKSNGIYSAGPTKISNNPEINIITRGDGAKGIKSRGILSIEGGATDIKTYGAEHIDTGVSPPDSNSATGIKAHDDMEIKGGTLKVESWGSKIKGMSIDGNFEMSAGNLNIRANDDGMKVHGNLLISGGTVNISSERRDGIDCNKDITITGGSVTLTVGQNRQGINCSGKENITPGIVKNSGF